LFAVAHRPHLPHDTEPTATRTKHFRSRCERIHVRRFDSNRFAQLTIAFDILTARTDVDHKPSWFDTSFRIEPISFEALVASSIELGDLASTRSRPSCTSVQIERCNRLIALQLNHPQQPIDSTPDPPPPPFASLLFSLSLSLVFTMTTNHSACVAPLFVVITSSITSKQETRNQTHEALLNDLLGLT
jgi:hypothetical protein